MTENEKLDLILSEVQGMKSDMTDMKSEMQSMKNDMTDVKSEMQVMKTDIGDMKSEIQDMQEDMREMNHKITKINLTIENEICVNIQRVAEGHLDLSRNLHDAMKPSAEVEMLSVKVRRLETNVKDLQEKIS